MFHLCLICLCCVVLSFCCRFYEAVVEQLPSIKVRVGFAVRSDGAYLVPTGAILKGGNRLGALHREEPDARRVKKDESNGYGHKNACLVK